MELKKNMNNHQQQQHPNNVKFQYCCGVNVLIVWSEGGVAYRMPIHYVVVMDGQMYEQRKGKEGIDCL